jgi:hypothetical protein
MPKFPVMRLHVHLNTDEILASHNPSPFRKSKPASHIQISYLC